MARAVGIDLGTTNSVVSVLEGGLDGALRLGRGHLEDAEAELGDGRVVVEGHGRNGHASPIPSARRNIPVGGNGPYVACVLASNQS